MQSKISIGVKQALLFDLLEETSKKLLPSPPRPSFLCVEIIPVTSKATMDTFHLAIPSVISALTDANMYQGKRSQRTVVICLDGTGDTFDADNSNIVK